MTTPLVLDLFCGAGGAATGYYRAGFDVVGVDIRPQPHYPFPFVQADAVDLLRNWDGLRLGESRYLIRDFAAIHASPPCQRYAAVTRWQRQSWSGDPSGHPDLVPIVRRVLQAYSGVEGIPYIIENVREAKLESPFVLCGSAFGLRVKRHRYFETNWLPFELIPVCSHHNLLPFMHKGERAYTDAMGCEWMTNREGREAIPPAYTEWIGQRLMTELRSAA